MATARPVEYFFAEMQTMDEEVLLQRITVNPEIFGGKPIVRGRRLSVEHVLGMLAPRAIPRRSSSKAIRGSNRRIFRLASCMPAASRTMSALSRSFSRPAREAVA
jgi:hypothetical protein